MAPSLTGGSVPNEVISELLFRGVEQSEIDEFQEAVSTALNLGDGELRRTKIAAAQRNFINIVYRCYFRYLNHRRGGSVTSKKKTLAAIAAAKLGGRTRVRFPYWIELVPGEGFIRKDNLNERMAQEYLAERRRNGYPEAKMYGHIYLGEDGLPYGRNVEDEEEFSPALPRRAAGDVYVWSEKEE